MKFGPSENAKYRALSLGGGVQSTALLLMAEVGEIGPRPDVAIFSDTGWEPDYVYDNIDRLRNHCSIPVVSVMWRNIKTETLRHAKGGTKDSFKSLPVFSEQSMLSRQCTQEYKILPVRRYIREQHDKQRKGKQPTPGWACTWIGISYDEIQRMKPSLSKWIDHRWPLIEKRMSRADCIEWLKNYGWGEVQKSSCIGCPFHDDRAWAWMKEHRPEDFEDACKFDEEIRNFDKLGKGSKIYLHRSRVPLREIDFGPAGDDGQLYLGDCGGYCHV